MHIPTHRSLDSWCDLGIIDGFFKPSISLKALTMVDTTRRTNFSGGFYGTSPKNFPSLFIMEVVSRGRKPKVFAILAPIYFDPSSQHLLDHN